MSASQRRKGNRAELEVRDLFRAAGFDCDRVPNSGGLRIKGDLYPLDELHVETKRQERVEIQRWIRQAEDEAPYECLPVVAWRTSRMRWRADLDLERLINLLAEVKHWREMARANT